MTHTGITWSSTLGLMLSVTCMQARNKSRSAAAQATAMVGDGYNSDEDVYATAENMDRALGGDAAEAQVRGRCELVTEFEI